jgi:hypothetical protein
MQKRPVRFQSFWKLAALPPSFQVASSLGAWSMLIFITYDLCPSARTTQRQCREIDSCVFSGVHWQLPLLSLITAASCLIAVMPLSILADVELQLIYHCLNLSSFVALARCSRWTFRCGNRPFAWRIMDPLWVTFDELQMDHVKRLREGLKNPLYQATQVGVRWQAIDGVPPTQQEDVSAAELQALMTLPRLAAIDARGRIMSCAVILNLLKCECLAGGALSEFHLSYCDRISPKCAAALVQRWPALERLSMDLSFSAHVLVVAPKLLHLTSLHLTNHSEWTVNNDAIWSLHCISFCERLKLLSLDGMFVDRLARAFPAPMPSLEHVSLRMVDEIPAGEEAYAIWLAAFACMCSVRVLELTGTLEVNLMLAAMREVTFPHLHSLQLTPRRRDRTCQLVPATLPSVLALKELLKSHSLLYVTLQQHRSAHTSNCDSNASSTYVAEDFHDAHADLKGLVDQLKPRVTLELVA